MSESVATLRLYNTLTRTKEVFAPIDQQNVRMYVCGPTVYDFAHIGNARPVIVFDVLNRLLRHVYGDNHVTYVRNITDVDDKINARALRDFGGEIASGALSLNDAIRKVTEKTANQFHADVKRLGCLPPDFEPRATEHIDGMVTMAQALIDKGHAYVATGNEGREVLFDTSSMADYGQLSHRKLDEQQAGARIEVKDHKKNPGDFVLWKESASDQPGWPAHFHFEGQHVDIYGRPGWHIECSVMSAHHLGDEFDIHGGGLDLIFPHHENEIAQSRCSHGTDAMAKVWMHNGFVQVEGRKMSKSEGNFVTINELLDSDKFGGRKWPGEVLRLAMLMTHYREPIDFSVRRLEEAFKDWISFGNVVREHISNPIVDELAVDLLKNDLATSELITRLRELRSLAAVDMDAGRRLSGTLKLLGFFEDAFGLKKSLNMQLPLAEFSIDDFVRDNQHLSGDTYISTISRHLRAKYAEDAAALVAKLDQLPSGVTIADLSRLYELGRTPSQLLELKAQRLAFIRDKNWADADRIRDELAAQGVQLKDGKDPETGERITTWEVIR